MAVLSILNEYSPGSNGLPISVNFNVPSNFPPNQLLVVTGSGWTSTTNATIGVQVLVESAQVGEMLLFSNGPATHRTFAPLLIPMSLAPGQTGVTLTLQDDENTPINTDQNDWFSAALIG